jgi:tetratricopeptide (TPR) repeat protein
LLLQGSKEKPARIAYAGTLSDTWDGSWGFESRGDPISTSTGRILHMAQKATPKKSTLADDPRVSQALQSYESGLRALQEHKFEKAKPLFQKVVAGPSKELADRAAVHLNTCNQHLERSATTQFKSVEEHFDYAVSLMNVADYVTAREHLEKLLKQAPKTDYVIYGLAALDCLTGHVEDSLRHLDEALRLNASLRFQARNDSDFQNLAEDPRFTELLYPDPSIETASREESFRDDESY